VADKIKKFLTNNIVDVSEALQSVKLPGKVITGDTAAAGISVGKNNIIKIHVAVDTYVAFGDDATMPVVSVTTTPGLLVNAGMHYIICTGDFVRTSTAVTRLELLEI
jgi:hypothetical protein